MLTRLIKPSYLVSLKSSIRGGISYSRIDLERENEAGAEVVQWQTTRTIEDKDEHRRAIAARSKARGLILRLCRTTPFGLVCPLDKADELDRAVKEAREVEDEFNAAASHTMLHVYIWKGEVASTDEEAVRALSIEVTNLVEDLQSGIDRLDVGEIRKTARKAREVVAMLGEEQSKVLSDAVAQARKAATVIAKRVKVDGEDAATVLAEIKRDDLQTARVAFLDYSEETEVEAVPIVDPQRFADLDVSGQEVG